MVTIELAATRVGDAGFDVVDAASAQSFPASDAPGWATGRARAGRVASGARSVARRFFEDVIARHCERAAAAVIAPTAVVHSPWGHFTGPGGVKRLSAKLRAAFPDYRIAVEDLVADGDRAAARWTLRGTRRGELLGVPPTGRPETIEGVGLFRLADGRIAEAWLAEH